MSLWSHRALSLALTLAGSMVVGAAALAQSPATSPSPAVTCAQLPALLPAPFAGATLPSLTVFAAASLDKPFSIMGRAWAAQHPGSVLTFSFDASSTLRAQIEQGAPVDVFASADVKNPQTLIDECLASAPVTVFASNHLVIVVPTTNPARIDSWDDLAAPGVRIVAAQEDVPITKYAELLIDNLGAQPDAPAGYAEAVRANIVSREDNVAQVLSKVQLGEGDAGIVYVSDATSNAGVTPIDVPADADVLAHYGAVGVGSTTVPEGAAAFVGYLTGPEAQAILGQFGFLPPQ